jgi:hypothetical protein
LGKPPKIQLMGRTIKYAPVKAVDTMMILSWNLKVSKPKGMLKSRTKKMRGH